MKVLNEHWFDCENPKLVRNKYTHELVQVGCGHCAACVTKRITRWVAPLMRESSCHRYTFFVTLTYSDEYLPKLNLKTYVPKQFSDEESNKRNQKHFLDLQTKSAEFLRFHDYFLPYCPASDIQKFIKRLRQLILRKYECSIRYFFHSDYGSTTFRPHWHGILWIDSEEVAKEFQLLIVRAWSLQDKAFSDSYSVIGRTDCQLAYNCARYVSSYVNQIDRLPAIYQFRDFKPKSFHSSTPPIGSLVKTLESTEQIIRNGFTKVTMYNPVTFEWYQTPLLPSFVRRLFPAIPSFNSLSKQERVRIYRYFIQQLDKDPYSRREDIISSSLVDSFLNDYLTLNQNLSVKQLVDKIDRVYYAVKRLVLQAQIYGVSYVDYDTFIEKYFFNRSFQSLTKQFNYEQRFSLLHPTEQQKLNAIIDIAYHDNKRCQQFAMDNLSPKIDPLDIDSDFFKKSEITRFKLVKRKCDVAYLERHPEFKKFHK